MTQLKMSPSKKVEYAFWLIGMTAFGIVGFILLAVFLAPLSFILERIKPDMDGY